MNIIEFFKSPVLELPKKRDDKDFERYFSKILDEFLGQIDNLSDDHPISTGILNSKAKIECLVESLKISVDEYLKGFPYRAYEELNKGIIEIREHIEHLAICPSDIHCLELGDEHEQWNCYRIRCGNLNKYQREDLFHIPFEQRNQVTSKRYSISGLPSLYLGGSIWVCWEELGRPDFHTMHASRFCQSGDNKLHILDFGYQPGTIGNILENSVDKKSSNEKFVQYLTSYVICLPIIAACSIKVLEQASPFVPEYIIPQMILQWLLSSTKWDGLRYFSTKIRQNDIKPEVSMNYVFPVRIKSPVGYCADLCNKFDLSEPIAWQWFKVSSTDYSRSGDNYWSIEITEGLSESYCFTDFCILESLLKDQRVVVKSIHPTSLSPSSPLPNPRP